jgi:signal transduction histidine kinase
MLAGLLSWAALGVPVLTSALVVTPSPWWWIAYLGYGVLLALSALPAVSRRRNLSRLLLTLQAGLGLTAFLLDGGYGFSVVLLILSACSAAFVLPIGLTAGLVVVQTLAIGLSRAIWDHGPTDLMPLAEAGVFAGFQIFAVLMIEVSLRERRARSELAALNVELATAQTRLAESSRTAERLRIAREMHDAVGHELTALAVNLEVAAHLTAGQAHEHVEQSRQLAKKALGELRNTVGEMREKPDLRQTLTSLFQSIPGLAVHFSVDATLPVAGAERDEALLRICQEIITNTVRHARAGNVWITITRSDDQVVVLARDDGDGGRRIELGNGLLGMRERFEQLGGSVRFTPGPGRGFGVEARLPT